MFSTDVETTIANAVCEQKLNLDKTKELVFIGLSRGEKPHAADVKLVETYFIKVLLGQVRHEVEHLFDTSCHNKEFVKDFTSHSDPIWMLNNIQRIFPAAFYITQLQMHMALVDEDDLTSLIANLKAYLWRRILEAANDGCAEMELLRSLAVCFQTNGILSSLLKRLTEFQRGLASQSRPALYLKQVMRNVDASEQRKSPHLRTFLRSVDSLKSDNLFLESQLIQLLRLYLEPIQITIKNMNNRSIIEVIGGVIYISEVLPQITEKISSVPHRHQVNELRFIALYMCQIDHDMEKSRWHGFNICVMATKINVSKKCVWDVSGVSSQERQTTARSGELTGEDGQSGTDGCAGESSGNVMILAEQMTHAEWLTVILNGGNGSNGQNGGNGANGDNGAGISMQTLKEKFKSPVRYWGVSGDGVKEILRNIGHDSIVKTSWKSGCNRYFEAHLKNGEKLIFSISRYFDFQCYLLYKGSVGKVGGNGGVNGLGGQGGFHGECLALSKENQLFAVKVQTVKGTDGHDGKPGRNGEYGKNGWDVGYTDYSWWPREKEFGTNQEERLAIDFSTDSSDRVYCGYRYDVLGSSACYATLKPSILEHRKLAASEKTRSTRKEGQRRKESMSQCTRATTDLAQ